MARIQCALLDNDGVLVNTERLYYEATREVLRRYDVELSRQCYVDNCMCSARGVWHLLLEQGYPEGRLAEVRAARDALYLEYIGSRDIAIAGAREFLAWLRESCRICVVTSSKRVPFDRIHQITGFGPMFDHVLTIEDYAECKPSPVPYLTGLARLGCDADSAVAVEDSQRGLISAHAAGLRCLVVPNEFTITQDFSRAWQIVPNLQQAAAFLAPLLEA